MRQLWLGRLSLVSGSRSVDSYSLVMSSIFTKIIEGEIPSHRIHEDDRTYAFLDINPRQPGHTLVIPKREVDYLFDLPAEDYEALWGTCRRVAQALKVATECARVAVVVLGYEVAHAHVHLIPTNELEDIPFPPIDAAAQAGLASMAQAINAAVSGTVIEDAALDSPSAIQGI